MCSTLACINTYHQSHAGYLSAVTIPVGAHNVVIREDPLIADNYFGGCTVENIPHHQV